MAEQFRILVVEDEETLNQSIVNSLRRDGYMVQGVMSGAEAIRILWTEECDVVVGDQKLPGADGFELLQWLRTNRPNTRMIMLSEYGSPETRAQALESGAVSYLEKPLNLHQLKEELRRLLQQTGFSASLDSFDLLDVIQIINISRKSIALLINTGLEERGVLRFQDGELIWAEYGILRGEEAFFALAAHMNGTVTHQPWNERISPNVAQPLSRLIFQALQYRSKYAVRQQLTGEQAALARPAEAQASGPLFDEVDDSPFIFAEGPAQHTETKARMNQEQGGREAQEAEERKEWWQESGHIQVNGAQAGNGRLSGMIPVTPGRRPLTGNTNIVPSVVHKTPASQRPDLPAWLTEQPARGDAAGQPLRAAALSSSTHIPTVQPVRPSPAEWQSPMPPPVPPGQPPAQPTAPISRIPPTPTQPTQPTPAIKVTEQLPDRQTTGTQYSVSLPSPRVPRQHSAEWQPPEQAQGTDMRGQSQASQASQAHLHSLMTPIPPASRQAEEIATNGRSQSGPLTTTGGRPQGPNSATGGTNGSGAQWQREQRQPTTPGQGYGQQRSAQVTKHNYPALVSALQTLGYSIPGFVAAAVVGLDGQPVAQVAVDDLDISQICGYFSHILLGVIHSLEQVGQGAHEETVITSENRHILLRIVGNKRSAFQVLITTREADPAESLEVMANVEGAISAALR